MMKTLKNFQWKTYFIASLIVSIGALIIHFKDYLNQVSELQEVETFKTEHLAPDFENFNVEESRQEIGRIKPKKCQKCKLFNQCEGIWKEYLKHYGDKELKPV